ncbi:MAG: CDP-diacylglycerol--glycerol-3-phosphate 3-phosphatidyltransferase [Deltaproteobacteria bacterium]|nr:CDP-diacylglycerol--glycerol-3-phosphate 3-phosphatidyltransferase [Deltaproteobacteria bacterium]
MIEGMTLPNFLTLARIFLAPSFLIAVIYHYYLGAFILFALAGITDFLDGFLARRLNQYSQLGTFLDPIADKILMTVSYAVLAAVGLIPAWLAVVVISKDFFICVGAAVLYFIQGEVNPLPSPWGKQTTFLQIVTVGVVLLPVAEDAAALIAPWLFWGTGVLTIFSGVQYIVEGIIALPPSKPLEKEMGRRKNNRSLILRRRLGRKAGVTEEI